MSATPEPEQPPTKNTITDAERPFDSSAIADVIIRSSNFVDFFTLKSILRLTSPIFNDMLSLDLGEAKDKNLNNTRNGLPIVQLEEDSITLHNLLLLIYPYATEPTDTIEIYVKVGHAAQKYGMDEIIQKLGRMAARCEAMEKEPLRAFAVAVHFNWAEVIRMAALNTLSIPLSDLSGCDELGMLTGTDYHGLLQWRFACQRALTELLSQWDNDPRYGFPAMAEHILDRLGRTGCPRSAVLMDESIPAKHLGSKSRSAEVIQKFLQNVKVMEKAMDETVSCVRSGQCHGVHLLTRTIGSLDGSQ